MGHGLLRWSLKPNITTVAHLLAYVTGLVNQELLLKNEYLLAENRSSKPICDQASGCLLRSEPRSPRSANAWSKPAASSQIAIPDTILGWFRQQVAAKFDGSRQRRTPGRPPVSAEIENLVVRLARKFVWGWRPNRRSVG